MAEIVEVQPLHSRRLPGLAPTVIHLIAVQREQAPVFVGILGQVGEQGIQRRARPAGQHHLARMAVLGIGAFDVAAAPGALDLADADVQQFGQAHAGVEGQDADQRHLFAIGPGAHGGQHAFFLALAIVVFGVLQAALARRGWVGEADVGDGVFQLGQAPAVERGALAGDLVEARDQEHLVADGAAGPALGQPTANMGLEIVGGHLGQQLLGDGLALPPRDKVPFLAVALLLLAHGPEVVVEGAAQRPAGMRLGIVHLGLVIFDETPFRTQVDGNKVFDGPCTGVDTGLNRRHPATGERLVLEGLGDADALVPNLGRHPTITDHTSHADTVLQRCYEFCSTAHQRRKAAPFWRIAKLS